MRRVRAMLSPDARQQPFFTRNHPESPPFFFTQWSFSPNGCSLLYCAGLGYLRQRVWGRQRRGKICFSPRRGPRGRLSSLPPRACGASRWSPAAPAEAHLSSRSSAPSSGAASYQSTASSAPTAPAWNLIIRIRRELIKRIKRNMLS